MNEDNKKLIDELCEMDSDFINSFFKKGGDEMGALALNNSIASFSQYLESKEGKFIPGMNLEYRYFMTTLLLKIDKKYLPAVMHSLFGVSQNGK